MPRRFLEEVRHFFSVYEDLDGTTVTVPGWDGRAAAESPVTAAIRSRKAPRPDPFAPARVIA